MRRPDRWLSLVLLCVPLLALTGLGAGALRQYLRDAERLLPAAASADLSRALGRSVRVDALRLRAGWAEATGVRIAEAGAGSADAFATVRRLRVAFSPRDLVRPSASDTPFLRDVLVDGGAVRIARNRAGRWNFDDFLRWRPVRPAERGLGVVRFRNVVVDYVDHALGTDTEGAASPERVRLTGVRGAWRSHAFGAMDWEASGSCVTGQASWLDTRGAYRAEGRAVTSTTWVRGACARVARHWIPAWLSVRSGSADAQVTVTARNGALHYVVTVDARDASGAVQYGTRFAAPIERATGRVVVVPGAVHLALDGLVGGARARIDGTVGTAERPWLDARVRSPGVSLRQAAAWFGASEQLRMLERPSATASLDVRARGPLDRLHIEGEGPVRVAGSLFPGIDLAAPARLYVRAEGPLTSPTIAVTGPISLRGERSAGFQMAGDVSLRVLAGSRDGRGYARFSGSLPSVAWRDIKANDLSVAGVWDGRRVWAEARSTAGGGRLAARGEWQPEAGVYRGAVSIRDADLGRLSISGVPHTRGRLDADVRMASTRSAASPVEGRAIVQVHGLNLYDYVIPVTRAEVAFDGQRVSGTATARGGAGFAVAAGGADLRARTLDVAVEAEGIRLGPIARALTDGPDPDVRGQLYVRDLHITGPWSRPSAAGSVYAMNAGIGDRSADFARATIMGDTRRLFVMDGFAQRLPAHVEFSAVIDRPLSRGAVVSARGRFDDVELGEAFQLAGETPHASGVASGELEALGGYRSLTVVADPLIVRHGAAGDLPFEAMGAVRWVRDDRGARVIAEAREATVSGAQVTGGLQVADDVLEAQARIEGLDLSLMNERLPPAVVARGVVGGSIDLTATLGASSLQVQSGKFNISGRDLEVNGVPLGALQGAATYDGRRFAPSGDGPILALGAGGFNATVTEAAWDLDADTLAVRGGLQGLPIDWLRRAVANSPEAHRLGDLAGSEWMRADAAPIPGALAGEIMVTGRAGDPTATVKLSGSGMAVGLQAVERFTVEATTDRRRLAVQALEATAADAALLARGELAFGERVDAEADVTGLTVEQIARWVPGLEPLQRATGTVESLSLRATGRPDQPSITGSGFLSRVRVLDRPGGRAQVELRTARLGRVTLEGGQLSVVDAGVTVAGGSADSPERFEASGNATVEWSWRPPHLTSDAALRASLEVRRQPLAGIAAAIPASGLSAEGTVDARIGFEGVFGHVAGGAPPEASAPRLEGRVAVRAPSIRWAGAPYAVSDLLAHFEVRDGLLRVAPDPDTGAPFGALIHPLDVVTGRPVDTANVRLLGAIALDGAGDQSLILEADRVPLRFNPLPVFGSGRLVGELSGTRPGEPGLRLALSGSIRKPSLQGEATVRRTDLRMPDELPGGAAMPPRLRLPGPVDFRLQVADQVRLRSAQLVADVRTPVGSPVRVESRTGEPTITGALVIDRGVLQFPTARLAIQPGGRVDMRYPSIAWAAPGERAFGVEVDLRASGRLTARSITGILRRYVITADVRGPLDEGGPVELGHPEGARPPGSRLRMTFRSDPADLATTPADMERRVIALLGGQDAIAGLFGGGGGIGRVLGDQFADMLAANLIPDLLERTGLPRALGLDDLTLDYARGQALSLNVSAHLGGPLHLGYWQRLTGPGQTSLDDRAAWRFRFSYRLRQDWQLSWTVNDESVNAFLTEGVFRF